MHKWLKSSSWITIILGSISLVWFFGNLAAYEYFRPRTMYFQDLGPHAEKISVFMFLGILMAILFILFSLVTIVYHMQALKSDGQFEESYPHIRQHFIHGGIR